MKEDRKYVILKISHGIPALAQWVNDQACLCGIADLIPSPMKRVKDLVLLHGRSQVWLGFDPWLGDFH